MKILCKTKILYYRTSVCCFDRPEEAVKLGALTDPAGAVNH
jgi:hypothetical protein